MSIVLYALGAGLFAWSAILMIAGESYAAMDIAASLAGWGAFTIGFGALVAAVGRLTSVIADRAQAVTQILSESQATRREPESEQIVPVFVPRGEDPAHFEPAHFEPAPAAYPAASEPILDEAWTNDAAGVSRPDPDRLPEIDPYLDAEPASPRQPAPVRAGKPDTEAPVVDPVPDRPAADRSDRKLEDLSRSERRAGRVKARQERQAAIETPPDTSPPLDEDAAGLAESGPSESPVEIEAPPATGAADIPPRPEEAPPATGAADIPPRPESEIWERPIVLRHGQWELGAPRSPREETVEPTAEADPVAETTADATTAAEELEVEEPRQAPFASLSAPEPIHLLETDPSASQPGPAVPEWLARARERRAARVRDGEGSARRVVPPPPKPTPQPRFEPEPVDEPVSEFEAAAGPQLLREGEHNGVNYRFYDDGSVEAATEHGVRRFATIAELQATVQAARGESGEPDQEEPEPAPEPRAAGRRDEDDQLDAALAELESELAPERWIDPDDQPPGVRR